MFRTAGFFKACLGVFIGAFVITPLLAGCGDRAAVQTQKMAPGYYDAEFEGTSAKGDAFLACGTGGRLDRIFEDGSQENIPLSVDGNDLTDVLIDGELTLVCGAEGTIVFCRNGGEFQAASGTGREHIMGLAQFKGSYYACTYSGEILMSDDGESWKTSIQLSEKPLIAIKADSTYLMAISEDTDIYKTKDGENWDHENYNKVYDGYAPQQIFHNMENYLETFTIIGSQADNPEAPAVMSSSNGGEVWSVQGSKEINGRPPEDYYPLTINALSFFDDMLLAACDKGRILTLTDCPSCDTITEAADGDLHCIAVSKDKVLAAGSGFAFEVMDGAEFSVSDN